MNFSMTGQETVTHGNRRLRYRGERIGMFVFMFIKILTLQS
jgi:hypothetical protein